MVRAPQTSDQQRLARGLCAGITLCKFLKFRTQSPRNLTKACTVKPNPDQSLRERSVAKDRPITPVLETSGSRSAIPLGRSGARLRCALAARLASTTMAHSPSRTLRAPGGHRFHDPLRGRRVRPARTMSTTPGVLRIGTRLNGLNLQKTYPGKRGNSTILKRSAHLCLACDRAEGTPQNRDFVALPTHLYHRVEALLRNANHFRRSCDEWSMELLRRSSRP